MPLFGGSNVFLAVIFGCFVVLIPRIILPLFRPRLPLPNPHANDYFQRQRSAMSHSDDNENSSPDPQNTYSNIRMTNADGNNQLPPLIDEYSTKLNTTFAVPMYAVGIGIFLLYTCFKYWSKRNDQENKIRHRFSAKNIQWSSDRRKFKYEVNTHSTEDEQDNEDSYAGLDPDYVAYLKARRQNELETKRNVSEDQRKMNNAFDEMKNSLSFINSKIGTQQARNNLTEYEVSQLQNRLAATEAQMHRILNAMNTVSNTIHQLTGITQKSLKQPEDDLNNDEEYHRVSQSNQDSENSMNDEEISNSEDESIQKDEENSLNNQEESSSSSYEDDDEVSNEVQEEEEEEEGGDDDDDDESESSSGRYGIMNTNYGSEHSEVDDYEVDSMDKVEPPVADSQTKVEEWCQRIHSQSLSSNESVEQDQSLPNEEQNCLRRRKHQE